MTLLQLQSRLTEARKAVSSAATPKAKDKALAELEASAKALALFESKLSAKTVKTVKKEERYEEEDESEDEDEDESEDEDEDEDEESKSTKSKKDDEPKKPMGKKADADESDDADDDDDDDDDDDADDDADDDESEGEDEDADEDEEEDEDEDEDEEARAQALLSARSLQSLAKKGGDPKLLAAVRDHVKSVKRASAPKSLGALQSLKAACQRVTGKKGMREILGALDALATVAKETEKLSADVAKIKSREKRDKVESMLAKARSDGKIVAKEFAQLRADGMKHGVKWLRAHLEVRPKMVRTLDDGTLQGIAADGSKDGDAAKDKARATTIDAQGLNADQRKTIELAASNAGMSFDAFVAEMNKNRNNAAQRAH